MSTHKIGANRPEVENTVARIRERRKRLGMSAEKLAQTCTAGGYPLSRSTLANLESGRKEDIGLTALVALAAALNTTVARLIGEMYCAHCEDAPPAGYQCQQCGKVGK